jgi:3-(3-hydroxy-phenyl)propionate hydroxylase
MDHMHGYQWRWITDGSFKLAAPQGVTSIDLSEQSETEGVVALWMKRHGVHAAMVRPDHYVYASAANEIEAKQLFEVWQDFLD